MKKLQIISIAILMLILSQGSALANTQASKSSAVLASVNPVTTIVDNRTEVLSAYLTEQNSPLAPYAKDFIKSADEYNLDWRLVPAISGLESGFGIHIPPNSYNGWGWGIYGDHVLRFNSWPEAIETISKGLRTGYLRDRTESDPYVIGPSYAASPTWAVRVAYFMQRLEDYRLRNATSALSLAL